ncbi:MAG: hypothetical protein NTY09_14970 [bacterium]|nr:hypothetical protein [bacterium]
MHECLVFVRLVPVTLDPARDVPHIVRVGHVGDRPERVAVRVRKPVAVDRDIVLARAPTQGHRRAHRALLVLDQVALDIRIRVKINILKIPRLPAVQVVRNRARVIGRERRDSG